MKRLANIDKDRVGFFISVTFMIFLVIFWEISTIFFEIEQYILPSPSRIIKEMINSFPLIIDHSMTTFVEIILGFLIALIVAVILSLLMDRFNIIKKMIYPILIISQTIPIMAIAPLLMIWFGFGYTPKIIVVVLVCFFPITINLTEGLNVVDNDLINLMKSLKASKAQIFFKCKLPSALPSFFAGLRIAATYSVVGAVISEWVGAKKGLGIYMIRAMKSFKTDTMFAIILFIIIITLCFVGIIDLLAKAIMPYNKKTK